jgi:hypothetical protein
MAEVEELKVYISRKFCENVGLTLEEVFGPDLSLAEIVSRSSRLHNSVDLMEAFARTSNALRKEHGVRVRLPALSLDTHITQVLELFIRECQQGRVA